jgi:hypothetical protein
MSFSEKLDLKHSMVTEVAMGLYEFIPVGLHCNNLSLLKMLQTVCSKELFKFPVF